LKFLWLRAFVFSLGGYTHVWWCWQCNHRPWWESCNINCSGFKHHVSCWKQSNGGNIALELEKAGFKVSFSRLLLFFTINHCKCVFVNKKENINCISNLSSYIYIYIYAYCSWVRSSDTFNRSCVLCLTHHVYAIFSNYNQCRVCALLDGN
jgi:hypothetical protein